MNGTKKIKSFGLANQSISDFYPKLLSLLLLVLPLPGTPGLACSLSSLLRYFSVVSEPSSSLWTKEVLFVLKNVLSGAVPTITLPGTAPSDLSSLFLLLLTFLLLLLLLLPFL